MECVLSRDKPVDRVRTEEADLLRHATRELYSFLDSMEREFGAVASKLQENVGWAREIADESLEVASSISSDEVSGKSDELNDCLAVLSTYLQATLARTAAGLETLERVQGLLVELQDLARGFRTVSQKVKAVSVLTRIESARLEAGAQSWAMLADDVDDFAHVVDSRHRELVRESERVLKTLGDTLAKVGSIEKKWREHASSMVDDVRIGVELLRKEQRKSAEAMESISQGSLRISRSVSEIVTFMQFSDITRQQTEHVISAIDDLVTGMDGIANSQAGLGPSGALAVVGDVCMLQSAQLGNTKHELKAAIDAISNGLSTIRDEVVTIVSQTGLTLGNAERLDSSLLRQVELAVSKAVDASRQASTLKNGLDDTVKSVARGVEAMAVSVDQIESIGCSVDLIAINARIKAAQSESGDALGVLAEATQALANQTQSLTEAVSERLRTVQTLASGLRHGLTGAGNESPGSGQLAPVLEAIRAFNEGIAVRLRVVEAKSVSLLDQLERAIAIVLGIAGRLGTIDEVMSKLNLVSARCRDDCPGAPQEDGQAYLRDISERYTMETERRIHRGDLVHAARGLESECLAATEDEFGDNVELF